MSAFHRNPDDQPAGAAWRALSGDPLPAPPQLAQPHVPSQPGAAQPPVQGGWQQPWQDEHGQWHYPYAAAQPMQVPPYDPNAQVVAQPDVVQYAMPVPAPAPAEQVFSPEPVAAAPVVEPQPLPTTPIVPQEQLAPVGPPRYFAPARAAQDPRRRTLAAVITFVCLLVALWAILGFLGAMTKTLSSVSSGTNKLEVQLTSANEGLHKLDTKTANLEQMSADTKTLAGLLGGIDGDMGAMLENVTEISNGMQSMNETLGTLQGEVVKVNTINADMADKLGGINSGLGDQVQSVRSMRRDVQATSGVLTTLPGRLNATNHRLAHVNGIVNYMGCQGITNNLEVEIKLGPIPNGSAKVFATVVPPGAWGMLADGRTPCPTR
jgi:hypothetical protein